MLNQHRATNNNNNISNERLSLNILFSTSLNKREIKAKGRWDRLELSEVVLFKIDHVVLERREAQHSPDLGVPYSILGNFNIINA